MRAEKLILLACLIRALFAPAAAVAAAPTIQAVFNSASYKPGIASGAWISITGSNLSTSTRVWADGDFQSGNLPTSLEGVAATVNGKPAYIYFVSPGQINVLAPDDPTIGAVPVQVITPGGASNTLSVTKRAESPGLFNYSQLGGVYAIVQAAATYELIAPPATLGKSLRTVPAAPGENLILYGTGFGPVVSGQGAGQLVSTVSPTIKPVTVTIGGVKTEVQFAGLIGSGLYQINVVVPHLPSGDAPIAVSVDGTASTQQAFVPIQTPPGPVGGQTAPTVAGCTTGRVNSITYSVSRMLFGQPDEVSIGGTTLCPTCTIKSPLFPEFAARMETSMAQGKNVQACFDGQGNVVELRLARP